MQATEQHIRAAAKLYDARRSMRTILGAKYAEVIGGYANTVRYVATERGIGEIEAAVAMGKEMMALHCDPIIPVCLLAAAVEIIEPSPSPTSQSEKP